MDIELRPPDGGKGCSITVGDRVTVRLPETPTTGYRWAVEGDAGGLRLVDDRFEGAVAPRGAGGERVLTFQAVTEGTTLLRLVNRRAWGSSEPAGTVDVEVAVLGR